MLYRSSLTGHSLRLLKAVLIRLVSEVHSSWDRSLYFLLVSLSVNISFYCEVSFYLRIFDLKFDVANGSPDTQSFDFFFKFVIIIIMLLLFHVILPIEHNNCEVLGWTWPHPEFKRVTNCYRTVTTSPFGPPLPPSMTMRTVREANLLTGLFQKINIIMFIFIIIKLINIMIIYFINSDVFYLMPLWSVLFHWESSQHAASMLLWKSKMDKTKLQFPEIFTKILSLGTSQYRTASKETCNLFLNTRS